MKIPNLGQRDAEDYTLTKLILRVENDTLIDRCKKIQVKKNETEATIGWIAQRRKRMELRREINKLKMDYCEFQDVSINSRKYDLTF